MRYGTKSVTLPSPSTPRGGVEPSLPPGPAAPDIEERLRVANRVATVLAASLEGGADWPALARLLVPVLADYCVIHVLGPDDRLTRLALAHADADLERRLLELLSRTAPSGFPADHPAMKALRSGMPQLRQDLSDSMLRRMATSSDHLTALQAVGPNDALYLPLKARGRVLGVLVLVMAGSGRRYTPGDFELAEQVATQIAIALDNARLFREAQEEIQRREDVLSTAAHELKTPGTTVKGYLQLVQRWLATDKPRHELLAALQSAEAECDRQVRLIDNLLDAVRPRRGGAAEQREPFDLGSLVAAVVERFATVNGRCQFELTAGPRAIVAANQDQIEAVLVNLLNNAVKYSPQGGRIQVSAVLEDGEAVVTVRDEGIGIPQEKQARIFERFYRAHAGTPDDYGGVGIGLHLTRELLARHGGRIWFTSQEGAGTAFSFALPLATAHEVRSTAS